MELRKVEKLVTNLHDKNKYVVNINLKKALNHGLTLRTVHRVIKFNQKAWLERYINRFINIRSRQNYNV